MREYKRPGIAVWFIAAGLGVVNVLMNLFLLRDLLFGGVWAVSTLMATGLAVFSLLVPIAQVSDSELTLRLAAARPRQIVPWASIVSWRLEKHGKLLIADLDGGRALRVPLAAVQKSQRDSFVEEFRRYAQAV